MLLIGLIHCYGIIVKKKGQNNKKNWNRVSSHATDTRIKPANEQMRYASFSSHKHTIFANLDQAALSARVGDGKGLRGVIVLDFLRSYLYYPLKIWDPALRLAEIKPQAMPTNAPTPCTVLATGPTMPVRQITNQIIMNWMV